jgi:hypothetical protein
VGLVREKEEKHHSPNSFCSMYLKMFNCGSMVERHLYRVVSAIVRQSVTVSILFVVLQTNEMFPQIKSVGTVMLKPTVSLFDPMKSQQTYFEAISGKYTFGAEVQLVLTMAASTLAQFT